MNRSAYFDHHATTPMDRRVLEAMMPYLTTEFGNPSSATHEWGRRAEVAVEDARGAVAELLGAHPDEIVFTAGATEANNLALKGAARLRRRHGGGTHLITCAIEHKSVLKSMEAMVEDGFTLDVVGPDHEGIIRPRTVRDAITSDTCLVSIMSANSEIGTVQPIGELASACRERGVLFHTDATQSVGKIPVDVRELGVDLLSLSGHKFYGPKGVGALFIRRGVQVEPLLSGGGQERGLRSGTLNVPGIVGLGTAARLARSEMAAESARLQSLRDHLWESLHARVPGCTLNGEFEHRLPGNLNVCIPGVDAGHLMGRLTDFACSAGSACSSGKAAPSYVLLALGLSKRDAYNSFRIGLGKATTQEEVDRFVESVVAAVQQLRPDTQLT